MGLSPDVAPHGLSATALGLALVALGACQEPQITLPPSLSGPSGVAVSDGTNVCMDLVRLTEDGLAEPRVRACRVLENADTGEVVRERGAIGLIPNTQIDQLAVLALDRTFPVLVDIDLTTPGLTHIAVGDHPVAAATSPGGEVAYTANQIGRTISVVNLWAFAEVTERQGESILPNSIELDGAPISVATRRSNGDIVVGLTRPSAIFVRPGVTCAPPAAVAEGESIFPGDIVDATQGCEGIEVAEEEQVMLPLDGQLKDMVLTPDGDFVWAIYRDRNWASLIALDEQARGEDACIGGGVAPCEIKRVGLTYGCADGIDNDGDGFTDQQDPQCYGPLGAESPDGIGRLPTGACANGIDDDGDGLADRDDPDCLIPSQESEEAASDLDVVADCGDGGDNDNDGLIDALDPDCYGTKGRTEQSADIGGYLNIAIDERGLFVTITQSSDKQVLVIDAAARALIDAPRATATPDPFAEQLGVVVARTPTPAAIDGHIRRVVRPDPRPRFEDVHALIEYEIGAHVVADNGFVYYVDIANVYCEVWETRPGGLVTTEAFYSDPDALEGTQEAFCLRTPDIAQLSEQSRDVASCEEVVLCQECQTGSNPMDAGDDSSFEACGPCEGLDAATFEQTLEACQLRGRVAAAASGLARRSFNPTMTVFDGLTSASAGQAGRANCEQPASYIDALDAYIAANPGAINDISCGSPLIPQPIGLNIATQGPDAPESFSAVERLSIIERRELQLELDEEGSITPVTAINTHDYRVRDEAWNVVYEGVLPGASRNDGIVMEGAPGRLDIGPLDPCLSDVREGDWVVITSSPGTETGGVPQGCEAFAPEEAPDDFLAYRVTEVTGDELGIEVSGDDALIDELPTRECFPRGVSYEVRAAQSWIVYGESSGIASGKRLLDGVCVPANGAEFARASSRVQAGERFDGPLFSFDMHEGEVPAQRDLSYTITLQRNFSPASAPEADERNQNINVNTARPAALLYLNIFDYLTGEFEDRQEGDPLPRPVYRRFIMMPDPSDDRVTIKNLANQAELSFVR